ncbi:uncharacterized protein [Haliotis cracherodii]|uniref:uncharacterized protein isoform X2 n=1 Tax=Haliotis cracherodii TaxID=6455 RepID=UPI0039E89617
MMRPAMAGLTQGTLAVLLLTSVHGKGFWVTEKDIGAEVQVSEMNQTLNWTSSASSCRRRGGHLYVETSDNTVESLTRRLEEDTLYWVGGTVVTQSWYWEGTQDRLYTYRGYIPASAMGRNRTTHFEDNQAFTCFTFCNSIYIALKETECVCLRNDPTPGNSSTSSVLCPGNIEESCGDAGGYSVYSDKLHRLEKFRKARMNDFRYVWGVLEISSGSNTVATSDSQTEMLMALCSTQSHDGRGIVPITTRQTARTTCGNRQGTLLQVTGTINNLQTGRYWIGLRRGYSWVWITGKPVGNDTTDASLPYRCLSVRRRRNTIRIENQDCAKQLRYICLTGESGSSGGEGYGWALPTGVAGAAAVLIIIAATAGCCARLKRKGVAKVNHKKKIGEGKRQGDGKRPKRESTDVEYSEVGDSTMMPSSPDSFAAEEGEYHIPYNAALCIDGRVQPYNQGVYSHTRRLGGEGANSTDYDVSTVNRIPSTPPKGHYDHIGSLAEQSEKDPPGYDTPRSTRRSVNLAEVKATKVKDENDHQRTEATCLPIQVSYSERENTAGLQYDTPRRGSPITVAHSDVAGAESRDRGVNTPAYDVPGSDRTGHVAQL